MIYCKICGSCEDEICCPPTLCDNNKEGLYCQSYFNQLIETYKLHNKLINSLSDLDSFNKEQFFELYDKLFDETYI